MERQSKEKIVLVAYDLNPILGSECRMAYLWLKIISKYYFVYVITDAIHKEDILKERYETVEFNFIETSKKIRKFLGKVGAFNISNAMFINKVKKELKKIQLSDFKLLHCITPAGVFSYNDLYRFGVPILIGPLGGALPTPRGFRQIFYGDFIKIILRDFFYERIRQKKAWQEYFLKSVKIITGTEFLKSILPKEAQNRCIVFFDTLVDTDFYVPLSITKNEPVKKILFAGRLEMVKGAILLVEAARICIQRGINNFNVEIAGDGVLRNDIIRMAKKYGIENHICLLGKLSQAELLKRYQGSDIFCLPTLREPGGTAILEAMACQLPVVTSDYGGPAFSITEECGIKIKPTSYQNYIEELSNALTYLIQDEKARLKMGENARRRAEAEFSTKAYEQKICAIYKEVIENA